VTRYSLNRKPKLIHFTTIETMVVHLNNGTYENISNTTFRQLAVVSGQWSVVSGQWSVVSGQWSVVSGQWSVVGGRWSVVGGRWSVVGGRLSVVGWQLAVLGKKQTVWPGWSLHRRGCRTQPDVSTPGTSDQLSVGGCRLSGRI
jgi:hypothetical protein